MSGGAEPLPERLARALRSAGMRDVPDRFSVAAAHQKILPETLSQIEEFIRLFDRVTTRPAWQEAALGEAGGAAPGRSHPEVCFFSAWDFHLPPGPADGWQLIEFNDNGSGLLLAALINRTHWELWDPALRAEVQEPPAFGAIRRRVAEIVDREAAAFFGRRPDGMLLILDDAELLREGSFRNEIALLRDLLSDAGWTVGLTAPEELRHDGGKLLWQGREVAFVVNRSTDFFMEGESLTALREAWQEGRVYVAPNPFTYATRSDKRLLEPLSLPTRDATFGIRPEEREFLSAHVPETRIVRVDEWETLASRKHEFVFKPAHGFAGRGLLPSEQIGRSRLRRLRRRGSDYVAQRRVEKSQIDLCTGAGAESRHVRGWTDLRVWAWRGERLALSGRASRDPDRIDLAPPGGWIATYAATR